MADPTAPVLPKDAPQDVKDFFDCKGDSLSWKKGKVDWLKISMDNPIGEGKIELTPDVNFEHGKGGSIDITMDMGYGLSGKVNASVNADGQLVVNDVSTTLLPFKGNINDSIKNINDWFKHNHKKLKPPVLRKGTVTLEKTATTGAYAPPVVPLGDEDENKPEYASLPAAPVTSAPLSLAAFTPDEAGPRSLAPTLLLMLIGVAILGLLTGYLVFGGPGPAPTLIAQASPTATPSASPTAMPSASPAASPTATPSASSGGPTPSPSTSLGAYISGVCARVKHSGFGNFVSYIDWVMYWYGYDVDHFVLVIAGTNDDAPVTLTYDPADGGWKARLGLHSAGDKAVTSLTAVLTDGTPIDITDALAQALGTDVLGVRYPQEDSFGICPSE